MFPACENQAAAWDVLKFATSEEQDGAFLEASGQMPMRTSSSARTPSTSKPSPDYKSSLTGRGTVEVPNVANSVEIWQTFATRTRSR